MLGTTRMGYSRQLATQLAYYHEELLDGLTLYVNPRAERPVPNWLFFHPRASMRAIDTRSGFIVDATPDGFLINRMVQVFVGHRPRRRRSNTEIAVAKKAIAGYLFQSRGATLSQIVHGLGITADGLRSPLKSMLSRGETVRSGLGSTARYRLKRTLAH